MPLPRPVSFADAYGVRELPGTTAGTLMNRNTHGGLNEHGEGLVSYVPQYDLGLAGEHGVDVDNRFYGGAPRWRTNRTRSEARRQRLGASVRPAQTTGYPNVYYQPDYDNQTFMGSITPLRRNPLSGTSSRTSHRIEDRWRGSGRLDYRDNAGANDSDEQEYMQRVAAAQSRVNTNEYVVDPEPMPEPKPLPQPQPQPQRPRPILARAMRQLRALENQVQTVTTLNWMLMGLVVFLIAALALVASRG